MPLDSRTLDPRHPMDIFQNLKVLAIAPHPDDIELGCAAFMIRAQQATGVIVAKTVTNWRERKLEAERSSKVLGYQPVFFDHDGRNLDYRNIVTEIERLLESDGFHVVLIPYVDDSHQDHRFVAEATISATRWFKGWIIYYYLPSSLHFTPNLVVRLNVEEYEKKMAALECHHTQRQKPFMDKSYLDFIYRYWGWSYWEGGETFEPYRIEKALL